MESLFTKVSDLSDSYRRQIKTLYLKHLCEDLDDIEAGEIETKMGLLERTIIYIITNKEDIIALTCLIIPTEKDCNIVKDKGVRADKDVYLYNLVVSDKYRRKGIASKILKDVEKEMISKDIHRIVLFVNKDNTGGISLYNKFGYKVVIASPKGFLMEKII